MRARFLTALSRRLSYERDQTITRESISELCDFHTTKFATDRRRGVTLESRVALDSRITIDRTRDTRETRAGRTMAVRDRGKDPSFDITF